MTVSERLYELRDTAYADFQSKLTPNIAREHFIGVRVPILRKLAKEIGKEPETEDFLSSLPHFFYDENMLHGLLISGMKDFDTCVRATDYFLPYVDNWAVCDTLSPKIFAENKPELLSKISEWVKSEKTFTVRFGIVMLMTHFLDGDFQPEYLEIPANVRSDEYYVKTAQAWFFATALAKQWESTVPFLENNRLGMWTHNKTVQKARESFRIPEARKEYLKSLKV